MSMPRKTGRIASNLGLFGNRPLRKKLILPRMETVCLFVKRPQFGCSEISKGPCDDDDGIGEPILDSDRCKSKDQPHHENADCRLGSYITRKVFSMACSSPVGKAVMPEVRNAVSARDTQGY